MKFICPPPVALTPMPAQNPCAVKLDQIVRLGLQRLRPGQDPAFTTASIKLKASWVAAMAAAGNAKLVVTPIFAGLVIPSSEGIFEGGNDNSTPFGIRDYIGETSVDVALQWRNLATAIVKVLRSYTQESFATVGAFSLGVFLFTKNGQIGCVTVEGVADGINPIAITNWRVGTRGSEGYNKNDIIPGGFSLPELWDESLVLIDPTDFNPLFDL